MQTYVKHPIGPFTPEAEPTADSHKRWIDFISVMPSKLKLAVDGLEKSQLDTPYRLGGWSPRQVVHHLADSHMIGYVRFKRAITEDAPTIHSFERNEWAELQDCKCGPIDNSIALLELLHARWTCILKELPPEDFLRKINDSEGILTSVDRLVEFYAWHGRHHTGHITNLRERMGW